MTEVTIDARPHGPLAFSDTIVAPATAPGRGALAVIRLSGRDAHAIARSALGRWPEQPRTATLTAVLDPAGAELDQ